MSACLATRPGRAISMRRLSEKQSRVSRLNLPRQQDSYRSKSGIKQDDLEAQDLSFPGPHFINPILSYIAYFSHPRVVGSACYYLIPIYASPSGPEVPSLYATKLLRTSTILATTSPAQRPHSSSTLPSLPKTQISVPGFLLLCCPFAQGQAAPLALPADLHRMASRH